MSKPIYKKGEELSLVGLAQSGDIKALEELIRRVQKDVYSLFYHLAARKEDLPDLTQETLLKMARSLSQLNDAAKFRPWLNKIATNVFYDYNRKNNIPEPLNTSEIDISQIKDKLGCEPGEKCLFTEIEKIIKAALMTLPQTHRITIVLREFEGLSYEDIAKITNTTLGTVKSRIARARVKLQEELRDFM